MYSTETFAIAANLWNHPEKLQKLITMLQGVQATRTRGICYSYQDFDIKQNVAAELHSLAQDGRAFCERS